MKNKRRTKIDGLGSDVFAWVAISSFGNEFKNRPQCSEKDHRPSDSRTPTCNIETEERSESTETGGCGEVRGQAVVPGRKFVFLLDSTCALLDKLHRT